jgi:hypothetical protein
LYDIERNKKSKYQTLEDLEKDAKELDKKYELYQKMKKVKKEDSLLGDEE